MGSYKPGDSYYGFFSTQHGVTRILSNADATPTSTPYHNGTSDASFSINVASIGTGMYRMTGVIPAGYSAGDKVNILASGAVSGIVAAAQVDMFVIDNIDANLNTAFEKYTNYNTWYVAKNGNDANAGHSRNTAKVSVTGAVSAAVNGDIIIIGTGTYTESVDLSTATKSLTLQGEDTYRCIITHATLPPLYIYNGCVVRNLTLTSTYTGGANGKGIEGSTVSNAGGILIEDCIINGKYDGVRINTLTGNGPTIRRCRITGTYDALNLQNCKEFLVEDCSLITDGSYSTKPVACSLVIDTAYSRGQVRRTYLEAKRTNATINAVYGIRCGGFLTVEDCTFNVSTETSASGDAYGIATIALDPSAQIMVNRCRFSSTATGGGSAFDLQNVAGSLWVSDSTYSEIKTSGIISGLEIDTSGWVTVGKIEGIDATDAIDIQVSSQFDTPVNFTSLEIDSDGHVRTGRGYTRATSISI